MISTVDWVVFIIEFGQSDGLGRQSLPRQCYLVAVEKLDVDWTGAEISENKILYGRDIRFVGPIVVDD